VVAAVHLQQLGDGEVGLDSALLEHDADPLAQLPGAGGRVDPEHPDLARTRGPVALEDLHHGRLTRAVGPEQAEHLAAHDLQAHAAHRLDLAVGATQVADLDGKPL
jgi:hypothetical protein